jgi:hypothetical protein
MACVFLEHITWFLLDFEGVERFATQRMAGSADKYNFKSDIFFTVSADLKSADIKNEVREWIKHLQEQPDCCEYLKRLLELIETRMLESNPGKRILASKLHQELKKLESFGRQDRNSSFYQKHWSKYAEANGACN